MSHERNDLSKPNQFIGKPNTLQNGNTSSFNNSRDNVGKKGAPWVFPVFTTSEEENEFTRRLYNAGKHDVVTAYFNEKVEREVAEDRAKRDEEHLRREQETDEFFQNFVDKIGQTKQKIEDNIKEIKRRMKLQEEEEAKASGNTSSPVPVTSSLFSTTTSTNPTISPPPQYQPYLPNFWWTNNSNNQPAVSNQSLKTQNKTPDKPGGSQPF